MSIDTTMTALADAIRSKTGVNKSMTLETMAAKVNSIFPAFYTHTGGSGTAYLTFNQVPFECDLVSIMLRWGMGNLSAGEVYTVFFNGSSSDSRYRKCAIYTDGHRYPYNVSNTVKVTNTLDSNGTYTVKIYCDGCVFSGSQAYVCFLSKKQG